MSGPRLVEGYVDEVLTPAQLYRVRAAGRTLTCAALTQGADDALGLRAIGGYAVGSRVLCVDIGSVDNARPLGLIVGAIPRRADGSKVVHDWVVPGSGVSTYTQPTHSHLLRASPTLPDLNQGTPFDALPGVDVGHIHDTGVGAGVNPYFAWMRGSDIAGVWAFYLDNLLRLAGHNFEFWHAGGEREIKNDQGEVNEVASFTPYPWEALGLPARGTAFTDTHGGHANAADDLRYRPIAPDQQAIARMLTLRGYVADGLRRLTMIPNLPGVRVAQSKHVPGDYTNVLDVHERLDGLYAVRSSHSITLEKHIHLPSVRRVRAPEHKGGDSAADTYTPSGAGKAGAVTEHARRDPAQGESGTARTWAAALFDTHARLFNGASNQALRAHTKDWAVDAEVGDSLYVPTASLADVHALPLPRAVSRRVDHRGSVTHYQSRAVVKIMVDGSILLADGYGSSLFMSGGNVSLSAPGDIMLQAGRSIVNMAGDDLVLRAGTSMDLTTAQGDLRFKAERNLHMLGANGGEGGILIESRSEAHDPVTGVGEESNVAGLALKSSGPLLLFGSDVYIKAFDGTPGTGHVIVDAVEQVSERAKSFVRQGTEAGSIFVDQIDGNTAYMMNADNVVFYMGAQGSFVVQHEKVVFSGEGFFGGTVSVEDGITPVANIGAVIAGLQNAAGGWEALVELGVVAAAEAAYSIDDIEFTLRTPEQYGTLRSGFCLVETGWQQLYRERSNEGVPWVEPEVSGTMPYPGKEVWLDSSKMILVDLVAMNWNDGRVPREREGGVEAPGVQAVSLSTSYLVTHQGLEE